MDDFNIRAPGTLRDPLTGKKLCRRCIYALFPKLRHIDSLEMDTGWRPTNSPGRCSGDDRTEIFLVEKGLGDERVVEFAQNLIVHDSREDPWMTKTNPCWYVNETNDVDDDALPYHPVKTLNLSKNQFGDEGLIALAKVFQTPSCVALERVMLGGNPNIGLTGIEALSVALGRTSCRIKCLSLAKCCIGNEESRALAVGLKSNKHMTELLLHSNVIGNTGADALGKALTNHPNLKYLDLSDNTIGDAGLQGLAEGLAHNTTLKHLYLNDIRASTNGLRFLVQLVKHTNHHIKAITTMETVHSYQSISEDYSRLSDRDKIVDELEFYLSLNQNGRSFLRQEPPVNLLAWALAKVRQKPDLLYGLLREIPHMWSASSIS